ncbi:MAG TPA: hypothetical protein VH044_20275 [Polyangiaceae bacterium]|jgi:hypothetical protein|nr:hypothetical protein [Polyangiaceae bacterium]
MNTPRSIEALITAIVLGLASVPLACSGEAPHTTPPVGVVAPLNAPPDGTPRYSCVDPVPLVLGGRDTGYVTCKGGILERLAVADCPVLPGRTSVMSPFGGCTADSDCASTPLGYCEWSEADAPNICLPGCVRDGDCAAHQICVCGDPVGHCEDSDCSAGTSCTTGQACAAQSTYACESHAFSCQSADDQCFSDTDCASGLICAVEIGATARTCSQGCQF